MKKRFKTVAALLAMSMAVIPIASVSADDEPATGYDYYHQEFTNTAATEQRLDAGAQSGALKDWTVHYPTSDTTFNQDSAKPEGAYLTDGGALRLQTYGKTRTGLVQGEPAASLDYSAFSGKDGNYTISFKMYVENGNRFSALVGKAPSGYTDANTAYGLTTQTVSTSGFGYDNGSGATAIMNTDATTQTRLTKKNWYDISLYINNTNKTFNVWIDGVAQKDSTGTDLPLSSNYPQGEDYVAPSYLTFTVQPSSGNSSKVIFEIDDLRIMPGKYDLLYGNSNWNTAPSYGRATGATLIIENGARYNNDYSLSLAGTDSTLSDYSAQFKYVNSSGTNIIDATKKVVTEMSFMPIENVGQVYFAQQAGGAISYRINPSNLLVGEWNKIKFIYTPATETEPLTSEIYLNGQRCYANDFTAATTVAAPTQTRLCVSRNPDDNDGDKTAENLQDVKCAVDDVIVYQTDAEDLSETYPTFTPLETWVATPASTAARYGGDLYIPEALTLSDIAACVGDDTEIRLFESDLQTQTTDVDEGNKLVLVSKTGVYAYYDIHIFNVAFTGEAVEGQSDGTMTNGELTATVGGTARTHGALVLALYDNNDRLISADVASANEGGTAFSVTQTVTENTKTARAFFWQDLNSSVAPVMEQMTLTKAAN